MIKDIMKDPLFLLLEIPTDATKSRSAGSS